MPITPTYPGVYIEEIKSTSRTIIGVATSIAAFIGAARKGPTNFPVEVNNQGDFERNFGGLLVGSPMTYAVRHFFLNGGTQAIIIRVANQDATKATVNVGGLELEASGEGVWGNNIKARVDHNTSDKNEDDPKFFNLFIQCNDSGVTINEVFRNLSTDKDSKRFVTQVLEEGSALLRVVRNSSLPERADASSEAEEGKDPFEEGSGAHVRAEGGEEGGPIGNDDLQGDAVEKKGIYALEKVDLFNTLCLPPPTREEEVNTDTYTQALAYCEKRRSMLLVDPPSEWLTVAQARNLFDKFLGDLGGSNPAKNAALFFPRIKSQDPLRDNLLAEYVPSGAVAGLFARIDRQRGVWKSPAGLEASLSGVDDLTVKMTDDENGRLNPLGVNCLRVFPGVGRVVWGSRTMQGGDRLASEWKYLAVRRFTLFLEESLYRGTQWVVFEPNDEPLWAQIRMNIGAFMQGLYRQGAFQGSSPQQAYYVKCDGETTTQQDIDSGIVNIHIGFAPLKPAEFVILKIQQISGQEVDG